MHLKIIFTATDLGGINKMNVIFSIMIVAIVVYTCGKIKNFNKSGTDNLKEMREKIPISKQILMVLACFLPYIIFFIIIMFCAFTFS